MPTRKTRRRKGLGPWEPVAAWRADNRRFDIASVLWMRPVDVRGADLRPASRVTHRTGSVVVISVVALLAGAFSGCASGTSHAHSPKLVKRVITVPERFEPIETVAVDASGGVWVWATDTAESHILYRAPTGKRSDWSLGIESELAKPFARPQIAACGKRAWLGIAHEVIPLDPTTGPSEPIVLPEPKRIPEDELQRPLDVQGTWAVEALACSGSHLAVGETDAREARLVDTASGKAAAVPLPDGFQVKGVAMNAAGIAAFGLQGYGTFVRHTVVLAGGSLAKPSRVTVANSGSVISLGKRFLIGVLGQTLAIDAHGRTSLAPVTATVPKAFEEQGGPVAAAAGHIALESKDGVIVVDLSDATAPRLIHVGTMVCPPFAPSPPPPPPGGTVATSSIPANGRCPVASNFLAAGPHGLVAFVPSNDRLSVDLLDTRP